MHPLKSMHERYAEVFSKLGYPIDLSKWEKPPKPVLPEASKNQMLSDTRIKIGFAPFAAFASKSYPLENAKELVRLLDQEDRYLLYLFGGGTEEEKFLKDMADSSENVFNMAGKGSFRDELNCMAHLDLMVSMDSGNGHLVAR